LINLGFILKKDLLPCSSYLPLGVPNWADIYTPSLAGGGGVGAMGECWCSAAASRWFEGGSPAAVELEDRIWASGPNMGSSSLDRDARLQSPTMLAWLGCVLQISLAHFWA
jgi:hypothetical protein